MLSFFKKGDLASDFKTYLNLPYARVTCSGTVALYVTLHAIQKITAKRTIIIPAFICPLVGLAVARAGLTLAVCDTQSSPGLDYDLDALEAMCKGDGDVAAIVVAHLGGMSANMDRLQAIATANDILLIEDCAQAFGAEYDGKKVGTMGDFAFYSFARGKGLTLYEGGVLVTRNEKYIALLEAEYQRLVPKKFLTESSVLLGLLGYAVFYRPQLFWFIFDSTYIFWNWLKDPIRAASEYNRIDFPIFQMSKLRQRLGHAFFHRVAGHLAHQKASAARYIADLQGKGDFQIIQPQTKCVGTYPYVALWFKTKARRDAMLKALRARGLGAFIIYIRALADYDYMAPYMPPQPFPNAKQLADCSLTLSTSIFLTEDDRAAINQLLTEPAHAQ